MQDRQFCTPHVVDGSTVTKLTRILFDERSIREPWFQNLLFQNPTLFPIDEIEPLFGPLIPVARELPTSVGPVDIVYINPRGYLTLVETKLFRNPEARREVVGQILDYATAISKWTYEDLCQAVGRSRRDDASYPASGRGASAPESDPISGLVCDDPDYDEARFIDTVSSNLARGRFLLLIAGDGIQAGVEHLADTLARTPHLGFSLALVEMALFKTGEQQDRLFVQPRVLARTREVVRAVIELRTGLTPADVQVTLPEVISGEGGGGRRRLTEEAMFETIAASLGQPIADQFRLFLAECEKLGIRPQPVSASISLHWLEPNTEETFTFGSVYADGGWVDLWFVHRRYQRTGIDEQIGREYVEAVAALVPRLLAAEGLTRGKLWALKGDRRVTLADLLPKSAEWLAALRNVITKTEAAGAAKLEGELR
jgi:hypothetical protein